jgi:Tol biopolymer transport system component
MMLSMFPVNSTPQIIWTNLEATSTAQNTGWGVVARTGDTGQAGAGAWSHDGMTVAYTSAPTITSGMNVDQGHADIYTVPYNGGAGGTATKLAGASDASYSESYAAFSHDDALIAFVRAPAAENPYDNAHDEVFLVPRAGGTATRLTANDPMECTTATSPGVANSWPKWSPTVQTSGGTSYYWLTFSSKRGPSSIPQIYVVPVTVDGTGAIATFPAIYLWNQPSTERNHTPAWDTFQVIF